MSKTKSIVIRPVLGRRKPDVTIDGVRVAADQIEMAQEPASPTHVVIPRAEYDAMVGVGKPGHKVRQAVEVWLNHAREVERVFVDGEEIASNMIVLRAPLGTRADPVLDPRDRVLGSRK